VGQLGVDFAAFYDKESDALIFDFGLGEPTVDLPEADGRMVWRVGRETDSVAGFCLLGAKRFGVSELRIDLQARKDHIEHELKNIVGLSASARISKVVIDRVCVRATQKRQSRRRGTAPLTNALNRALDSFQQLAKP
jgi:hypothetical protein